MNSNDQRFDGRMTPAHKEKLEEWHSQQIDELLERVWKTDPAFRATMQALDEADSWELSDLEYYMAGNVAGWAADGFDEADWFEGLGDNRLIQSSFSLNNIPPANIPQELEAAIATLKIINLWPWI